VRLSQQILLLLRGKLMKAGLQHQETAGGHRGTKFVGWNVHSYLGHGLTTRPTTLDFGPWIEWL